MSKKNDFKLASKISVELRILDFVLKTGIIHLRFRTAFILPDLLDLPKVRDSFCRNRYRRRLNGRSWTSAPRLDPLAISM